VLSPGLELRLCFLTNGVPLRSPAATKGWLRNPGCMRLLRATIGTLLITSSYCDYEAGHREGYQAPRTGSTPTAKAINEQPAGGFVSFEFPLKTTR
jgi:hypothetical protein